MLTYHRKQLLLARLSAEGQIIASAIAAELGISEDTIRRDLRELAAEGLLTRVHGGALPASPAIAPLDQRRSIATPEKIRLAQAALPLIQPGQTIFIDGGTTHAELIRVFPATLSATIVTHSPTIAAALEPFRHVEVILIGGRLFRHSMVAVGTEAADAIRRLRFDLLFLGLTGLHPDGGLTTGDYEEAAIKRTLVGQAADCVVLATSDKLGAVSKHQIIAASALTRLIISADHAPTARASYAADIIAA